MSGAPGGINKIIVKDGVAQFWGKLRHEIAGQLEKFISVVRRAGSPEGEAKELEQRLVR